MITPVNEWTADGGLQDTEGGCGRIIALVQDQVVVSTMPGYQEGAAIDLARVLCRAGGKPVDIYRLITGATESFHSGSVACLGDPTWEPVAQVRNSEQSRVEVSRCHTVA